MRRLYKTTEFWMTVASMVLGYAALYYGILHKADLLGVAAVITAISTNSVSLIIGRSKIKEKSCE